MKRSLIFIAAALSAMVAQPALAGEYYEHPAPIPNYPFQRSYLIGQLVTIPPYRRPFVVRVYTTPPQQPYYNVPPYAVIAPY